MYPNYNVPYYMMDKQPQQFPQQPQQTPPNINQTFQLAPNQPNNNVRYAMSLEEVKKELVFGDTVFVNKEYTRMWSKNARGETKEYELIEIVELDPKDAEIKKLQAQIEDLKQVIENATNNIKFNDEQPRSKRPAIGRSNKNDDE
jgi:hypothetical protein